MAKNLIFRGTATNNRPVQVEAQAAAELTPGNLVYLSSGKFAKHATAGGGAGVRLYLVDLNVLAQGTTTDTFAADETTLAFEPRQGERYNALVATGQTLVKDSPLASNGNGTLRLGVVGADDIICYADEAITTTAAELVNVKF